jgi:group I intron endonuclease
MQAIYQIKNKIDGKIYIGSTNNIRRRWNNHRSKLNNNKHENSYLQSAWNKYGQDNFEFIAIEEVNNDNRIEREVFYLNERKSYERNIGYNFDRNPTDKSGKNNPFHGKKHSNKSKERLKDIANNRSDELKKKMGSKNKGEGSGHSKLTWNLVSEIRCRYMEGNETYKSLGEKFDVAKTTIQAIIQNRTWVQ